MIPTNEVGMLVAPGSTGKSMFLLQLVAAVATGRPFLGRFPIGRDSAKRNVVIVCGEDRIEHVRRRLQMIFRSEHADLSPDDKRLAEARIHVVASAGAGSERLILKCPKGEPIATSSFREFANDLDQVQPALVVIDPLSRFLSGNVDLQSEVGTAWVDTLESLVRRAKLPIAVWFAHHSNKLSRRPRLHRESEEPESRGTSSLFDGVRVEGYLANAGEGLVAFRIRKNNHGPRMEFKDRVILRRGPHGVLTAITAQEREVALQAQERIREDEREDTRRRIIMAIALDPKLTNLEALRDRIQRGKRPTEEEIRKLRAGVDGASPWLLKKGRGAFRLLAPAIAEAYPELVDTEQGVIRVGDWCREGWPPKLQDPNATIPLDDDWDGGSEPLGDSSRVNSHTTSAQDDDDGSGAAVGGNPQSDYRTGLPIWEPRSGPMGRLRTPPSVPARPLAVSGLSPTQSDSSPIRVRSDWPSPPRLSGVANKSEAA